MTSRSVNPFEAPRAKIGSTGTAGRKGSPGAAAPFQVVCECGHATGVVAAQAGSSVSCRCGKTVPVPSLGQLREGAGQGRYESSLADTIRRMISTGDLPAGNTCALTGAPTDSVLGLAILVPQYVWTPQDAMQDIVPDNPWVWLLGALVGSSPKMSDVAQVDPEIVLTPILIAPRARPRVIRMGQWRLKRLLGSVPVYRQFLEEHEDAWVLTPKP